MDIKELKAKQYSEKSYPYDDGMRFQCECHFESGWDEALKSQWVSAKDRLPRPDVKVLVMFEYCGGIQIHDYAYMGGNFDFGGSEILAWMPIPSFDDILKANKDVLQRLKDR